MSNPHNQFWNNTKIGAGHTPSINVGVLNGLNEATGTTYETIWIEGGIYVFPTTAETMTISSDNANDTSGGTGMQTMFLVSQEGDRLDRADLLTLNGTTPVTIGHDIFRINSMINFISGSGLVNEGTIYIGTGTVTAGKPAVVYGIIGPGHGVNKMAVYSIAANVSYQIYDYVITSSGNKQVDVRFIFSGVFGQNNIIEDFSGTFNSGMSTFNFVGGGGLSGADIRIDAKVASGTNTVSFYHLFHLTDNNIYRP